MKKINRYDQNSLLAGRSKKENGINLEEGSGVTGDGSIVDLKFDFPRVAPCLMKAAYLEMVNLAY